jgi:predicted PurR-regulated permease PerM
MRLRRHRKHEHGHEERAAEDDYYEVDPGELSGIFSVPAWLRDVGMMAWLLVGVSLFLVGMVWLASLTQVIVVPVITAAVVAAVASPLVRLLAAHRVPRPLGAALVLLGMVLLTTGGILLVIAGISDQLSSIGGQLDGAKNTIGNWLSDLGVDTSTVDNAKQTASSGASDAVSTLLSGLASGVEELSSLVFFLAMTVLSLFFLLSDGPQIRGWAESHMGVPTDVARVVGQRTLGALRGYFLGVTIVAAFNAVVVTIGALALGVPLVGTLAVVTFFGAFIPYLGAWTAGAFAVLIALGGAGTDAAAGMIVVQLLANGVLQQLVQPFAMGAALGIHPLAVLIVTIAGGALFGAIGLILAAPLVSAATRISADLARARASAESAGGGAGVAPEPSPS